MTTANRYDVNRHLHLGGPLPTGARPATIKAEFVYTAHRTVAAKTHRPSYAIAYWLDGRMHLGCRYACGGASANVRPQQMLGSFAPCERCEVANSLRTDPVRVLVYGYFDTEGKPLYIGQSRDLASRHVAHRKSSPWFTATASLRVLSGHDTRGDALTAEAAAIRELRPLHNIRHNPERAA